MHRTNVDRLFLSLVLSLSVAGHAAAADSQWMGVRPDPIWYEGSVGIGGVTSPGASLEVSGSGAKFSGTLSSEGPADGNVYAGVFAGTPRVIWGGAVAHQIDNHSGKLRFFRPGAISMVVDAAGNLGIGTDTPGATLDVAGGGARFTGTFADESPSTPSVHIGVFAGTPRVIWGGPVAHQIDNYLGTLRFFRAGVLHMAIDSSGQVSIGGLPANAQSTDRLVVNGAIRATSIIGSVYEDLAEWVPATEAMAPGTVVVVKRGSANTVTPSTQSYDTRVAGVVSAAPGVLLGVEGPGKAMIATTGRVKIRVDATRTPIEAGDLLATSDEPGTAMRSEPVDIGGVKIHRPGTLIGKALEPLKGKKGEILVLLSLQ